MSNYTNTIISWNVNGLRTRLNSGEIYRMVKQYNPIAICLQHVNAICQSFDNYVLADNFISDNNELGTSIYCHKKAYFKKNNIKTPYIQATTIELKINKEQSYNIFKTD